MADLFVQSITGMKKIKMYLKKVLDFFGPTINPALAKDERTGEQQIFPTQKFVMDELRTAFNGLDHYFSGYEINMPDFYVRSFNEAFCFTNREEVFTGRKSVIIDYTSQRINPRIGESKLIFHTSRKKKINAVVAHLSLSGLENNYYHFLTECLARVYLVEKSHFKPDFYIIANHLNFQTEMLDLLGITSDRIIPANSNLLVQAKTLIVPDFINNWKRVYYRGVEHAQKQWQPVWLANAYREKITLLKNKNIEKKKIYISRDKAKYRNFVNQNEVNSLFTELCFETYYLEEMNIREQIKLFSNAGVVVGIHGAGFANIYFSDDETKIFEIYTEYYHDSSYRILAQSLGLKYSYFIGQTADIENTHPQEEDVYVDIHQLKYMLVNFINE